MSKSYLVPHDFQSVNLGYTSTVLNAAGSTFVAGADVSGELVTLNATGGSAVSVPGIFSGLDLTFVVANTGAHTITLPSACVYGTVGYNYAGTSGNMLAAASTVISTTAGSAVGDCIKLTSDGTKCYLSGTVTAFNAIKLA
jgi:hypothetical protein